MRIVIRSDSHLGSAWPGVVGADGLVLAALGLSFGILVLAVLSLGLLFPLALLSLGGGLLAAGFLALVLGGAVLARLVCKGIKRAFSTVLWGDISLQNRPRRVIRKLEQATKD